MLFPLFLDPIAAADRRREFERDHPERATLLLAAAGAAKVLGERHSATKAFARAAETMGRRAARRTSWPLRAPGASGPGGGHPLLTKWAKPRWFERFHSV